MRQRPNGSAVLVVIFLLAGFILAAANLGALVMAAGRSTGALATLIAEPSAAALRAVVVEQYRHCAPCLIYLVVMPLIVGGLLALTVGRRAPAAAPGPPAAAATPAQAPTSPAPALRLLALLQQEARLIDFITEDIDAYDDAQVGAAARSIHAACRKTLSERVELQRVFDAEDGSEVEIEEGFDPASVRLTGNVAGAPPFRGTLQHGGWRATKISLPESPGSVDPAILAPAEVDIA